MIIWTSDDDMWWNECQRRWERHPDCTCNHKESESCLCRWLRPLDRNGKPIDVPMLAAMRERLGVIGNKDE